MVPPTAAPTSANSAPASRLAVVVLPEAVQVLPHAGFRPAPGPGRTLQEKTGRPRQSRRFARRAGNRSVAATEPRSIRPAWADHRLSRPSAPPARRLAPRSGGRRRPMREPASGRPPPRGARRRRRGPLSSRDHPGDRGGRSSSRPLPGRPPRRSRGCDKNVGISWVDSPRRLDHCSSSQSARA